jgi:hypothetical protein
MPTLRYNNGPEQITVVVTYSVSSRRTDGLTNVPHCYGRRRVTSCPCREWNPDHPAGSPSLYRLNYPGSPSVDNRSGHNGVQPVEIQLISRRRLCLPLASIVYFSAYSSTLKIEAIRCSEKSGEFPRNTRRYIPEVGTLHNHRCQRLTN